MRLTGPTGEIGVFGLDLLPFPSSSTRIDCVRFMRLAKRGFGFRLKAEAFGLGAIALSDPRELTIGLPSCRSNGRPNQTSASPNGTNGCPDYLVGPQLS